MPSAFSCGEKSTDKSRHTPHTPERERESETTAPIPSFSLIFWAGSFACVERKGFGCGGQIVVQ